METAVLPYSDADSTVTEVWETESTPAPVTQGQISALSSSLDYFFLLGMIAPGWQISRALLVSLEQDEDGSYLVSDDLFGIYGEGDTPTEAVEDYLVSLIDYYQLLSARVEEELSFAQGMLARLQRYVSQIT